MLVSPIAAAADPLGEPPELAGARSFTLASDLAAWPRRLWEDARVLPSWESAEVLSLGGGWAFVAAESEWDREIRRGVAENPRRLGDLNDFFSVSGHPLVHVGGAALLWAGSLWSQDSKLHELALDLFNSFVLTDVSNQGLKYVFDSDRPNGERFGFPSGHTASSFALASVVQSHYGLFPGLVAYGLAAAVGWHRVDEQQHELSDVLAGAAIGYVIGRSVTSEGALRKGIIRVIPYSDPYGGGAGVAVRWRF